jgi:hypothetical protein
MNNNNITLGYILAKYRLKYKLEISQLAHKLSTDKEYLIALENGNYSVFKSLNQAVPIIRKLSYFLGLKYQVLIDLYNKEYEIYLDLQKQKTNIPKIVINHSVFRLGLSFSIVSIIVGYLILQVYQIRYSPAITLANNNDYQVYDNFQYKLEGVIARADQLTLNGQKVNLKEDGKFEILLNLRQGENKLELAVQKDDKLLKKFQKTIYKQ